MYSGLPHAFDSVKVWTYDEKRNYTKGIQRRQCGSCDGHNKRKKGELSFVVNLGVAYDGIPLDEPLVPSVIFSIVIQVWSTFLGAFEKIT